MASEAALHEAVSKLPFGDPARPLSELATIHQVSLEDGGVARVSLSIAPAEAGQRARVGAAITERLGREEGISLVKLDYSLAVGSRAIADDDPLPGVKHVVLVMSGKGGVGKSTVATNLAVALSQLGARVGLLDADMYGPSLPTMLGINGRPMSDGQKIQPLSRFGLKLMSIGFLLEDPKAAVVWRGPMLHGALMQFLQDVDWGVLDTLVLDLPPGTGDVALTLSQRVRASGAVVVTTPQEVALQDVYKAVSMNEKVGIRHLGVIENLTYFECEHGSRYELFGRGGGQRVAEATGSPLLGQIPLVASVREWGDAGTPVVQAAPASPVAQAFFAAAGALVAELRKIGGEDELTIDRSGGVSRHLPIAR